MNHKRFSDFGVVRGSRGRRRSHLIAKSQCYFQHDRYHTKC